MEDNNDIVEQNRRGLEKIFGEPIVFDYEMGIAGIERYKNREVMYFEFTKKPAISTQFRALLNTSIFSSGKKIDIEGGTCVLGLWTLTLPSGKMFRDLSYDGDIPGWRRALEASAAERGLRTGRIEDLKLVISDGEIVALSECSARRGPK
ncbi:hypothetical protein [Asaia spathodeae]|uniref:Uncharacterized protein n=1 Tax=Asaia spathodeae TaxID=657016 RepID=A0ABX2P3Z5_9PROT|nr:hypothetical protein [Asaia spathodeae]GBR22198.1 hypothetical protein AA105894_2995 [Asaia spathodeae NBRC 105894]